MGKITWEDVSIVAQRLKVFQQDKPVNAIVAAVLAVMISGASVAQEPSQAVTLLKQTKPTKTQVLVDDSAAQLFEWTLDDFSDPSLILTVVLVKISANNGDWRLVPVSQDGHIIELTENIVCERALAVTTGGFYSQRDDGLREPLWLSISNGEVISPFVARRFGGVIAKAAGKTRIFPVAEFPLSQTWSDALQSSPIIVRNGQNDMYRDDNQYFDRLAIGLDMEESLVIFGVFRKGAKALSLYNFAEMALAFNTTVGIRIDSALALDGGPSAHLYVPSVKRHYGHDGIAYLPNALCISAQ